MQATELHPMLRGDLKALSGQLANRSTMPRISSIKANQRKEAPKRLKIERQLPASFTDPEKNPYLDTHLGSHMKLEPKQKQRGKMFQFVKPGRFVAQAEKLRTEAKLEQLKMEIDERVAKAQLDDQKEALDIANIVTPEPPLVEWWDKPYIQDSGIYGDHKKYKITGADSPITIYIQHPVPLAPPMSISNGERAPAQIMLTQKERKKLRRQRRREQQREHREKVMLGLLPPDQPRLTMANFMRIMASQSVPDPTRLEAEVKRQVQARQEKHEAENAANKLTKEQKHEKNEARLEADEKKGILTAVFKISNLQHPQHRYKVSVNATQMHLTGAALICPGSMSLVVVEGPEKQIKAYKKLLLRRIDWEYVQPKEGQESGEGGDVDLTGNECHMVWQGQVEARRFNGFRMRDCPTETQARNWLAGAKCEQYWSLGKQYRADDGLSAVDPLI
ncbi:U4/U5/U6 small nuclear ribonucleoprotein prp3 [Coemansia sp. Benny D115]|nr:U4/U5/U6 small nuclear ribonucleoprotein prp3 [Coemansia sp. Benny D115]